MIHFLTVRMTKIRKPTKPDDDTNKLSTLAHFKGALSILGYILDQLTVCCVSLICSPKILQKKRPACERETTNSKDRYAVSARKDCTVIGYLPIFACEMVVVPLQSLVQQKIQLLRKFNYVQHTCIQCVLPQSLTTPTSCPDLLATVLPFTTK